MRALWVGVVIGVNSVLSLPKSIPVFALFCVFFALSCGDQVVVRETEASCGNGELETGEACDDGNEVSTDSCTTGCTIARCGDGTTRMDLTADLDG